MKLSARHFLLFFLLPLALPSCVGVGGSEIMMIALVVLLLFGGAKLPALMRGMGSGVHEFKKGLREGEGDEQEKDGEQDEKGEKTAGKD